MEMTNKRNTESRHIIRTMDMPAFIMHSEEVAL